MDGVNHFQHANESNDVVIDRIPVIVHCDAARPNNACSRPPCRGDFSLWYNAHSFLLPSLALGRWAADADRGAALHSHPGSISPGVYVLVLECKRTNVAVPILSKTMTDEQAAFRTRVLDYRRKGAQALLDHGVEPDSLLHQEVQAAGVDQRYGVNLIVRPPLPVITYIHTLQQRLAAHEPEQYFYPSDDLHLTLVELCSSRSQSEAETLAAFLVKLLPELVQTAPRAVLVRPLLGYDRRACAVNFLPTDRTLQALRDHLIAQLASHGVMIAPRYAPQSAHVTIMRYLRALQSDWTAWVEILEAMPGAAIEWQLDAIWLTWGATWYGMQGRTKMKGPYRLGYAESQEM
jgi:2'-5' RNA ligase